MYLKFGTYSHELNEAEVVISREAITGINKQVVAYRVQWVIRGRLLGDSAAELTTKIRRLQTAYSLPNRDATLFVSGSTKSAHQLRVADTISGVRVERFGFPKGRDGEYVTYRDYEIVLAAEELTRLGKNNDTVSWTETIRRIGNGGPRYVVRETRNSQPVRQLVSDYTPVRVVQTGNAAAIRTYPAVPAPMYPEFLESDQATVDRSYDAARQLYTAAWNYVAVSPTPI